MEGDAASSVSVAPLLLFSVQFWLPDVSPNFSVPITRDLSSVTVRSADRFTVLKSAVFPLPEAGKLLSHLPGSLQAPSASLIHVPFPAVSTYTILGTGGVLIPLPRK